MKLKLLLIIGISVLMFSCHQAIKIEQYPVRLCNVMLDGELVSEYEYKHFEKIPDTLEFSVDQYNFIYYTESFTGKMSFIVSDSTGIRLKGQYLESLGVLGYYNSDVDMNTGDEIISITNYYEPIKEGEWIYYLNSKVEKKEHYLDGGLIYE